MNCYHPQYNYINHKEKYQINKIDPTSNHLLSIV
jgi:hypothetical protein